MIAIIDYGVGNLFSLKSSFAHINSECIVTSNAETIKKADKIILPGVGAFEDAIKKLRADNLDKVIIEKANLNKPILGICLGMQLLFEKSYEYGEHLGLGIIEGNIKKIEVPNLKVPHMGWNSLIFKKENPLLSTLKMANTFILFTLIMQQIAQKV